jgi:hypothetical protein
MMDSIMRLAFVPDISRSRSAESITASVPSKMALQHRLLPRRVGRGFWNHGLEHLRGSNHKLTLLVGSPE